MLVITNIYNQECLNFCIIKNNAMSMKPVNKLQLLDRFEAKVEAHIQLALTDFQNSKTEVLLARAADGGWSIAQCLDHLNSYGHFYLPLIQKKLSAHAPRTSKETFTGSWLGNYFTRMMNPDTGKKKFKALKGHIPVADPDAPAVVAEFIRQQEILLSYIYQARVMDLDAIRIPLSVTRWLTLKLGDVFAFLIAHNERHIRQAKKNL